MITAALPYANGPVHIGHLAGVYIPADVYARFQRRLGSDVAFICGSDEHGIPITIRAKKEGVTPQDIVPSIGAHASKHSVENCEWHFFAPSTTNFHRRQTCARLTGRPWRKAA